MLSNTSLSPLLFWVQWLLISSTTRDIKVLYILKSILFDCKIYHDRIILQHSSNYRPEYSQEKKAYNYFPGAQKSVKAHAAIHQLSPTFHHLKDCCVRCGASQQSVREFVTRGREIRKNETYFSWVAQINTTRESGFGGINLARKLACLI